MKSSLFRWFRRPRRSEVSTEYRLAGPIRGELLGAEHLAERARNLAARQRLATSRRATRTARLLNRLQETRRILDQAYERFSAAALAGTDIGPAGEWLLDNYHIVQEHMREVHESLPRDYYRELPELSSGPLAGYPRVYELVITLISHTEGRVDAENVDRFFDAFQERTVLSLGELWAVPAMLRLGLLENIRRMALRTVQRLDEIEAADRWVARIQADNERNSPALADTLAQFVLKPPALSSIFVSRFLHQLRMAPGAFPPLVWLEEWITQAGLSPDEATARATDRLALTKLMMSNSILSLRAITQRDWRRFVEGRSVMEKVLREDPSGFYPQMSFATRDEYRHVVERIAKRTRRSEESVAREAVRLARGAGTDSRRGHVGYYLVDRGLKGLEATLGYRPRPREAFHRGVLAHPNVVFVGGLFAATAGALGALFWLAGEPARTAWLGVILVGFLPANDIAVSLVNQLVTLLLPPRLLPKLDFRDHGLPEAYRTVVVIPTLFDNLEEVAEALENLEVQYLANRESHLHFALLSDFKDSPTETRQSDAAIIGAAEAGVQALNARYAPESADAFYLFHRPRRWNAGEAVWMGWERKRGKLAEFNQFLRGGAEAAFATVVGNLESIRRVRYVITLDSDTQLPPGAAPALIGALAHPLNRAEYDPARGRVVRGYGILQPRVGVSLASAHRSRFASIYSGHPGIDPYTTAVSDVYQDLYGEGSYTGKGIYDVDAFERATRGRFPENTLLSHDLIEGSYARAGLVTDITVYDDYPTGYLTFTRRKHRWIRGDWQLLRWLTPWVPGALGTERNRLSLLARWKLVDNLRRSLVELAQLALLIAGWTVLPGSPLRWTLLALGAIAAPWLLGLLLAVARPPRDKSWWAYYRAVGQDAITSVQQIALAIAFLPHQAWISLDAIGRTLGRLFVTRRRLLEWERASRAERNVAGTSREVWRAMGPATLLISCLALTLLGLGFLQADPRSLAELVAGVAPLALLWSVTPAIAYALSLPSRPEDRVLRKESVALALRYARLHWNYFDRFVSAESHWLAPDNFQDDPGPMLALRTSPTNIGLQLLATVSARDLGFITLADMTDRLERAFATLGRLARLRGHFYNWYDLRNLAVLEPAYISTVDSGNLAGHLIALRQALLDAAGEVDEVGEVRTKLQALAGRAEGFLQEMEFGFLFDSSRKLFSIGYVPASHSLDGSFYDLLASEARLASFVAIAKNEVPVSHWFRLGRALVSAGGDTALVSWSGSMFEYLMPVLVMHSFPFTVLGQSNRGALGQQRTYARERGIPWGISESAYNVRDRQRVYQYRGFGVPWLALRRGLGHHLVVAPYASALAAQIDPERSLENLQELERLGALGDYGFYDAIDYSRPDPGKAYAVVRNFLAHHVGMTLVSLTNTLRSQVWQQRFHSDPMIRAVALLLDERIPRRLALQEAKSTEADEATAPESPEPVVREIATPHTSEPRVALLGHSPYTVMVSNSGGGYSRFEDLAVTRWRADGTLDDTGQFCYVKDVESGRAWSAGYQPLGAEPDWYRAVLATDRVTLERADGEIATRLEIAVVPEDAAEVRRVTLTNNGNEIRELEVTSYGEIVLAPPDRDRAHPAFGNLFVETEYHEWCTAITATRRPRSATERALWCVHVVDTSQERIGSPSCETDRGRFLGRGRSTRNPVALEQDGALSGTTGAVLDPVFALRTRVRLLPGQAASVAFTTLVATSRERAFALADRYHDPHVAERSLDLARTATHVELRELEITPAEAAVFQELAGHLFYPHPALRAPEEELRANEGSLRHLWSNGLSGDWPIVLATIESTSGLPTLQQVFAAHRYWRRRGMTIDLFVLNTQPHSYQQELNDRITESMLATSGSGVADAPGGIFIRQFDALDPEDLKMIAATARVRIDCDGRPLARILTERRGRGPAPRQPEPTPPRRAERSSPPFAQLAERLRSGADSLRAMVRWPGWPPEAANAPRALNAPPPPSGPLRFDNGMGGLTAGDDYRIRINGDKVPPAPWANVIANPRGGFLVTERGGGFSWAGNSYFFRLTPWHNDPVSDPVGDALYLQDEETGELWSATPAPARGAGPYVITHGAGGSSFEHEHDGISSQLTLGLAGEEAIKVSLLRVTNRDRRPRRLSLTAYAEWTLGVLREHTQHQVRTDYDPARRAIFARNPYDPQFAQWVAFCAMSEPIRGYTASRREFVGRNGTLADPVGQRLAILSGATGPGLDPCAVLRCVVELAPGETREVAVLLGACPDEAQAQRAVDRYGDAKRARQAVEDGGREWAERLGVIRVRTPEPGFDAMLNRWALYQALSCRMWGRSAIYQSSGAYGFRDQLQDVMAFVYAEPRIARAHLVRAAGRQFEEGDVQHWWHPESGRGVRTRFSDDLAWLPYAADHYIRVTGDARVLDETVPFLRMRPLEPGEAEAYDLPGTSSETASLYHHCLRALNKACTAGQHGLPLIGTGDWNDGMNRVGIAGQGESIWLAWFLIATLRGFAAHAENRGDTASAQELRSRADAYAIAVETHGWDGLWYRRAYFDDGTPLGSATNPECRIDSIAQSWSVISAAGDPARQEQAMRAVEEQLVDQEARIIKLLTPPFDTMPQDPGYIKGYLPGVRENGAQYTHAALWVVLATALRGQGNRAFELFQMLNPFTHAGTAAGVARYKVEPYVVPGDVYAIEGARGRGGWTWYTGSASWMYRVGLEAILGFTKQGSTLRIAPCVPAEWPELTIEYRYGTSLYVITVQAPGSTKRGRSELDGRVLEGGVVPLVDDGQRHEVVLRAEARAPSGQS